MPTNESISAFEKRYSAQLVDDDDEKLERPRFSHVDSGESKTGSSESDTTSGNSEEEFDWFGDDDNKSTHTPKLTAKRGRWLWLAFMKLARPVRVVLVTLIGSAIFVTPLLVVNLRYSESVVKTQVHVWSLWFTATWISCCLTYLMVDAAPALFLALATLWGAEVERLKTQVDLIMAVKGYVKLALDITWSWIALSVFRAIYQPYGSYWTTMNRLMQALFSAGIIILVEKLALHFVAINFHQKALADRIDENETALRVLDVLSAAQPTPAHKRTPPPTPSQRGHRTPAASADGMHTRLDSGSESASALPDVKPMPIKNPQPKRRKKVTTVIVDQIGQVALKHSKFHQQVNLTSTYSARRLARKLFSTLNNVHPPRSYLVVEDFYPYFRTTAEAHEAFAVFDKDGNGDISKREMRESVQRIYQERKALVSSLKDVGSIVAKLDVVLLCVALLIIIFITLLIFNRSNTLASLVPLATIILGFSFIFGHSAQTLFESLIFIFSTHIFDVGDLVMIDDQILFVKEFGLFSTTFRRVDGQEVIAPNSLLASDKIVHNLRRSKSMWETTTLTVAYDTSLELIEQLRGKIMAYVSANSREWSNCALNIDKMEFQNAIHLIVAMEHRPNWQDWGGRWTRRTAFMRNLKIVLEELDIQYSMPIQPVLLPRGGPSVPSQLTPTPHLQPPPPGRRGRSLHEDMLGNGARSFADSQYNRSPVQFRTGPSSFDTFA